MRAVYRVEQGLGLVLRWVCIALFVVMVLLVTWQVLQRQVLIPVGVMKTGFPWTTAAGQYCFIWLGLLGAAYVIGERDDVAIDFLVRKFHPAVSRVVECVAHVAVAFFAVWIMMGGGYRFVSRTWDQPVELLPFSQGQLYSVLLVSGFLIALYCVFHIAEAIVRPAVAKDEAGIDLSALSEEGI